VKELINLLDTTQLPTTVTETKSDRGSMSSCGSEEWGQIGSRTSTEDQSQLQTAPEAMPDFRRTTVCNLVESYKVNINIVYPILSNRRLDMLVEAFLRTIPPDTSEKRQYASSDSPGRKRKRSPVASDAESINHGRPFRSISTALVLLVLALGKICRIRGKIPGPVPDETNRGRRRRPIGDFESWGHTRSPIVDLTSSSKLERFGKFKTDRVTPPVEDNAVIFAFWICIQIER
jgi:hypothetical protein